MRISDWSSDVCSSDLDDDGGRHAADAGAQPAVLAGAGSRLGAGGPPGGASGQLGPWRKAIARRMVFRQRIRDILPCTALPPLPPKAPPVPAGSRPEERRVGQEGVSRCRPRWSPDHKKNKISITTEDRNT